MRSSSSARGIAGLTCACRLRQPASPCASTRRRTASAGACSASRPFRRRPGVRAGRRVDRHRPRAHPRAGAPSSGSRSTTSRHDPTAAAATSGSVDGRRYSEDEMMRAFAPLAAAIAARRRPPSRDGRDHRTRSPAAPGARSRITLAQWLDRNGAPGWLRTLIEVAYTTEMGLELRRAVGAQPADARSAPAADTFDIFGESDERFHVRGGNDLHPAAARRAALGDAIETGCVLEALRAGRRRPLRAELRSAAPARSRSRAHQRRARDPVHHAAPRAHGRRPARRQTPRDRRAAATAPTPS